MIEVTAQRVSAYLYRYSYTTRQNVTTALCLNKPIGVKYAKQLANIIKKASYLFLNDYDYVVCFQYIEQRFGCVLSDTAKQLIQETNFRPYINTRNHLILINNRQPKSKTIGIFNSDKELTNNVFKSTYNVVGGEARFSVFDKFLNENNKNYKTKKEKVVDRYENPRYVKKQLDRRKGIQYRYYRENFKFKIIEKIHKKEVKMIIGGDYAP